MKRVRLAITILVPLLALCAVGANAALVRTDLIGGLGEFEFSADTTWQAKTNNGWPLGVAPATPDDSVAAGWSSLIGYGVTRIQDTIYRIVPSKGLAGSNCQYFALRSVTPQSKATALRTYVEVRDDLPFAVHTGDTLTFRIDRLYMSGYSLPSGATARYRMIISCWVPDGVDSDVSVDLTPSQTPRAAEVTATVVPGTRHVSMLVEVTAGGASSSASPGIYVDGARLFHKPAGSNVYDTEEVPAPTNRAIKTHMMFYEPHEMDAYAIARDYDVVMTWESDYPYALRLRYYHPDIKIYLDEDGGDITDWRDQSFNDPPYSNSPLGFAHVLAAHVNWLYPWPAGFTPLVDNREPWLRNTYFLFWPDYTYIYPAHVEDPVYQREWRDAVIDKATRFRFDGIFMDSVVAITPSPAVPAERDPSEAQSFVHGTCPYLRQAGIQVAMNDAVDALAVPPSRIYFYPSWKTDRTYTPALGYENNTPENTPDTFFQEWTFFKHWPVAGVDMNHYDLDYWEACLDNLETPLAWNKSLATRVKKNMFAMVSGVDTPGDPALGLDGWAHFGLCSFMLAQNQYTWFGARYTTVFQPIDLDLSGTVRLGAATSNRGPLTSDNSLQMRLYRNGLVIVNGHPTDTRTYRIRTKVIDESGTLYPTGLSLTLQPHTGRMFFYK